MPLRLTPAERAEMLRAVAEMELEDAARMAAKDALLARCLHMCRSDGVALGEIAAALADEINELIGET